MKEAWVGEKGENEAWDTTTEVECPGTSGQLAPMGERRKPALSLRRKLVRSSQVLTV